MTFSPTFSSLLSAAFAATPDLFSYRVRAFSLSWQPTIADTHFKSVALAYLPRVDGVFLIDNPQQLVLRGEVANIPFVTGSHPIRFSTPVRLTSCRWLRRWRHYICIPIAQYHVCFLLISITFGLTKVRNDSQLETYLRTIFLPNITDSDYQELAQAYSSDVTQGSPFDTEHLNALTPEYKRISSFIGDFTFQAPFLTNYLVGKMHGLTVSENSFFPHNRRLLFLVNKRLKSTPIMGAVSNN